VSGFSSFDFVVAAATGKSGIIDLPWRSEDLYISVRSSYWSFERRRQCQIIKNCPGQIRHLLNVEVFVGFFILTHFFEGGILCVGNCFF